MRTRVLAIAAVILALFAMPAAVPSASAYTTVPTLSVTVLQLTNGTSPQFQTEGLSTPNEILVPQIPITLSVTVVNNDTMQHTFTMDNNAATPAHMIDVAMNPGENYTITFTLNSLTNVTVNGTSFTPEADPTTGAPVYYCIPHRALGMKGVILPAGYSAPAVVPEKGVFLRAYWIGLIGMAAMLVWIGITYFVIKSSSPRFKDNREHVRKGLP